jgi:putative transposase
LFEKTIYNISANFEVEVLNIECDKDHFHMIFKAKQTLDIPKYINSIKTISSREIRWNFPEVKEKLGKMHSGQDHISWLRQDRLRWMF